MRRLRTEADMAEHRNPALDQKSDGRRNAFARFDLDRLTAGLLHHARGGAEGGLGALLVGAQRQVDDDKRAGRAAHHGAPVQNHHVERHADGVRHPVQHHSDRIRRPAAGQHAGPRAPPSAQYRRSGKRSSGRASARTSRGRSGASSRRAWTWPGLRGECAAAAYVRSARAKAPPGPCETRIPG